MSKKLINSICLIIIAMVMCINGVDAFTLIKGEAVQIKSDGVFHEIFEKSIESNGTLLYCLSGANVGIYDKDYSDKMIIDGTYTEEQRLVIGNIINTTSLNYYQKEVAIFTYLNIKDGKYDTTSDSSYSVVNDEITNAELMCQIIVLHMQH